MILKSLTHSAVMVLVMLCVATASSANNFTMTPGQTIVVPASNVATSVTCIANNVSVLDHYCTCIDAGPRYMKKLNSVYVMSDGQIKLVFLGNYGEMSDCELAKKNQDSFNH